MAIGEGGVRLSRDVAVFLPRLCRPPRFGKEVAHHEIDLHTGAAETEGKHVLVPGSQFGWKFGNVGGVVEGTVEFLHDIAGGVLAGAADAGVAGYHEVAAPAGGLECVGGRMEVDSHAAVDYRDEMGYGYVVEYVAGNGPVHAGENEVAIEGLAVGVLVFHAFGHRTYTQIAGGTAAQRLGACACDLEFSYGGFVCVQKPVQIVGFDGVGVDECDFRDADACKGLGDKGANTAEPDNADAQVLDVPLRANAPRVDCPALELVVFEGTRYGGFPVDGVLHRRWDSDLSAPRADNFSVGLLPEACAPVSVVAHSHAE